MSPMSMAADQLSAVADQRFTALPAEGAADALGVDPATGLDAREVAARRQQVGPNRLAEPARRPAWLRFLDQFRSGIVYVLAGAALLAGAVGDWKDPIVIAAVLLVNGVLGYVQEARADAALSALTKMLASSARVRRDGRTHEVPSDELVPGDVVLLDAGDRVPADGRLLLTARTAIDESSLTGESVPVEKDAEVVLAPDAEIGDRRNAAFMNSTVVRGRAEMVVTATGMQTEMGKVAELLGSQESPPTPLQRQLDRLSKTLAGVALAAVTLVFVLRLVQGDALADALLASVALAVAAIPEGLPAVVTLTLAIGVSQMAKRQAIVKRLHSVETLGATTVICSDKTGTLTLNQMTVTEVMVDHRRHPIGERGADLDAGLLLEPVVLANEATTDGDDIIGEPTEVALLAAARELGIDVDRLRTDRPRTAEVPFDSATKLMATFHIDGDGVGVYVKGAPDVLLDRCRTARTADGGTAPLDEQARQRWRDDNEAMANGGLRVLAVATRELASDDLSDGVDPQDWLEELRLEGLIGIIDPPRPEAAEAIGLCRTAGIDVKMITGDHGATARAIASQLGIRGEVITGREIDAMNDDELRDRISSVGVCARVSPEHKVRVVDALHDNGEVVAMTGDGVNDAAALRRADIGVAMGVTGTEVTKEAGDMVLADDNFATIVGAVRRGRTIYTNIVKFVRFQLTTNLAAIGTILGASVFGLPMPLNAIQVLWVNIIADGPPAMTLGVDPADPAVMRQRPRSTTAAILTRRRLSVMILSALVMAAGTLALFVWARDQYGDEVAATMAFTTFVLFQMFNVFNARSERRSVFSRYSFTNPQLWIAVAAVVGLQLLAVKWGPMQSLFDTVTLTAGQWSIAAAVAATVVAVEELRKALARLLVRRRGRRAHAPMNAPKLSHSANERTSTP